MIIFKISLTTGFVKINGFFFLFINSKLYAVIVDENVVIVCFLNYMRRKKRAWVIYPVMNEFLIISDSYLSFVLCEVLNFVVLIQVLIFEF